MFADERHDHIIRLLERDGRVSVTDLAAQLEVTEGCIRKDLKALEDAGLCRKVYGGAIPIARKREHRVDIRKALHSEEKRAVAAKAYALINDGDAIYLDLSSSSYYLAEQLAAGDKRCLVISNMLQALSVLSENELLNVIATGGSVNAEQGGMLGSVAYDALSNSYFDKVFLGSMGIDMESLAVTTYDINEALLKQCAIKNATECYLLVDSTKFNRRGNYRFGQLDEFTAVITESIGPETRDDLSERGVKLMEA